MSHVEPYLLFDPTKKYVASESNSTGILTMLDYKKYLNDLNGKVDAPKPMVGLMKQMSSKSSKLSRDGSLHKLTTLIAAHSDVIVGLSGPCSNNSVVPSVAEMEEGTQRPLTSSASSASSILKDNSSLALPSIDGSAEQRPQTSPSSLLTPPGKLQRGRSGTLLAHNQRGGPETFLNQKTVMKAYKQFIREFSKDSLDGELVHELPLSEPDSAASKLLRSMTKTKGLNAFAKSKAKSGEEKNEVKPKTTPKASPSVIKKKSMINKAEPKMATTERVASFKGKKAVDDSKSSFSESKDMKEEVVEAPAPSPVTVPAGAEAKSLERSYSEQSVKRSSSQEDADLSIYQDDDDFESLTSQVETKETKEDEILTWGDDNGNSKGNISPKTNTVTIEEKVSEEKEVKKVKKPEMLQVEMMVIAHNEEKKISEVAKKPVPEAEPVDDNYDEEGYDDEVRGVQ